MFALRDLDFIFCMFDHNVFFFTFFSLLVLNKNVQKMKCEVNNRVIKLLNNINNVISSKKTHVKATERQQFPVVLGSGQSKDGGWT